ncbi:CinA family protein [Opitutus terrae]|uniref:CinA domain protein n=1 Tax=Opitutus terrae (strain DSM 11246 / JCM 15787 / PB90-1) TaxID=452637 RepID=B1ZST8_OPITP|nr:nicotinamide-nucleotide amidohydrolase family protein [Opitutus terrae]ACB74782.1 CinA domain protein [Opitutus terrae PB90-1]
MNSCAEELKQLMLQEPRWSLAVAESMTAGNLQARVAAVSGASAYFRGGMTAYTIEQKVRLLGIDRAEAERTNCVSVEVARQMARGACARFDADVAVATTGYAEPSKPNGVAVPFAWWAAAFRTAGGWHEGHGRVECPGAKRAQTQGMIADAVLAELVAWLRELRQKSPAGKPGSIE